MVSKNANKNGPKTIFGAPIPILINFAISLINEECTLAKSSKRNNTVLSDSNNSFFSEISERRVLFYIFNYENQYIYDMCACTRARLSVYI